MLIFQQQQLYLSGYLSPYPLCSQIPDKSNNKSRIMKNQKNFIQKYTLFILLTFFSFTISFAQESINYSQVKQVDGLVMQRLDNTEGSVSETTAKGLVNFHHRPPVTVSDNSFDFIYMRATEETENANNMVLTNSGLLMVGNDDGCGLVEGDIPADLGANTMLYINGEAAKSEGTVAWTIASDKRLKKNIVPLENSLSILQEVDFVEFEYNGLGRTSTGNKYYGVLAQQVQEVLPSTITVSKRKLNTTDRTNSELLMFNANDLIFTGLNAVKELADIEEEKHEQLLKELEQEKTKNRELENRLGDLEDKMEQLFALMGHGQNNETANSPIGTTISETTGKLYPNMPNPLNQTTLIRYELPENVSESIIVIQDLVGKTMKTIELNSSIKSGIVQFDAIQAGLTNGMYVYVLMIDGSPIDTGKMTFIK